MIEDLSPEYNFYFLHQTDTINVSKIFKIGKICSYNNCTKKHFDSEGKYLYTKGSKKLSKNSYTGEVPGIKMKSFRLTDNLPMSLDSIFKAIISERPRYEIIFPIEKVFAHPVSIIKSRVQRITFKDYIQTETNPDVVLKSDSIDLSDCVAVSVTISPMENNYIKKKLPETPKLRDVVKLYRRSKENFMAMGIESALMKLINYSDVSETPLPLVFCYFFESEVESDIDSFSEDLEEHC